MQPGKEQRNENTIFLQRRNKHKYKKKLQNKLKDEENIRNCLVNI